MSKILSNQEKIIIWENTNFVLETRSIPHVSKFDGGHLVLSPVLPVIEIFNLSSSLQNELIRLISLSSLALKKVLFDQGIMFEFTNNQDNGNCSYLFGKKKSLHIHIYGRVKNSKVWSSVIFSRSSL